MITTVTLPAPTIDSLARSVAAFNDIPNVDRAERRFAVDTAPAADLGQADHRVALLRFLNAWGCRIRVPRDGEPDLFDAGIGAWWAQLTYPLPQTPLHRLGDTAIARLATAFEALRTTRIATTRTLGSTAAAKALYAMRPDTVMPWDAAIAQHLHGGRDGAAFARHLALGREWAVRLLTEVAARDPRIGARGLPAYLGRGSVSLAKILDEYAYVMITRA